MAAWLRNVAEETGAFALCEALAGSRGAVDASRVGADALVTLRAKQARAPSSVPSSPEAASPARGNGGRFGMADGEVGRRPPLVLSLYLPRVAEICRMAGVNYLDKAGNCRIVRVACTWRSRVAQLRAGHPAARESFLAER